MTRKQALTAVILAGCLVVGFPGVVESAAADKELPGALNGRLDSMESGLRTLRSLSARPSDTAPLFAEPLLSRLGNLEKETRALFLRSDAIDERLRLLDQRLKEIGAKAAEVLAEAERRAAEAKEKEAKEGDPPVAALTLAGIKMANAPFPLPPSSRRRRPILSVATIRRSGCSPWASSTTPRACSRSSSRTIRATRLPPMPNIGWARPTTSGATRLGRGWIFADGYERYGDGKMAAEGLLKLGMSLAHLSKWSEACATFDRVQADFPDAPDYIEASVREQRQAVGCQ